MKRTLPFIALLVVLLCWVQGWGLLVRQQYRQGFTIIKHSAKALQQGDITRANETLRNINIHELYYFYETTRYDTILHTQLLAVFGSDLAFITDSLSARRSLAKVNTLPQPLRELAQNHLYEQAVKMVGPRNVYALGIRKVFRERQYIGEYDSLRVQSWKSYQWHQFIDSITFFCQGIFGFVHFAGIGVMLILAIIAQWFLAARKGLSDEPYQGYHLSIGQLWGTLSLYTVWLASTCWVAIQLQWLIFKQEPFRSGFVGDHLPTLIYFTSAILSFTLCLLVIIMMQVRRGFDAMRTKNGITQKPNGAVLWFSILNEYKRFLWFLWPVWSIELVYLIIMSHY